MSPTMTARWPSAAAGTRPRSAAGSAESGYAPDAVICSTALRARETWELASAGLRAAVPGAAPAVRYESRVYEATVLGLLMLVREFPPEWRTALLVGHNPGMAELTVGLADPSPDPPSAFPTAAVAVLACPAPGPTPPRARPACWPSRSRPTCGRTDADRLTA